MLCVCAYRLQLRVVLLNCYGDIQDVAVFVLCMFVPCTLYRLLDIILQISIWMLLSCLGTCVRKYVLDISAMLSMQRSSRLE
jgi:hypothetical protein